MPGVMREPSTGTPTPAPTGDTLAWLKSARLGVRLPLALRRWVGVRCPTLAAVVVVTAVSELVAPNRVGGDCRDTGLQPKALCALCVSRPSSAVCARRAIRTAPRIAFMLLRTIVRKPARVPDNSRSGNR